MLVIRPDRSRLTWSDEDFQNKPRRHAVHSLKPVYDSLRLYLAGRQILERLKRLGIALVAIIDTSRLGARTGRDNGHIHR